MQEVVVWTPSEGPAGPAGSARPASAMHPPRVTTNATVAAGVRPGSDAVPERHQADDRGDDRLGREGQGGHGRHAAAAQGEPVGDGRQRGVHDEGPGDAVRREGPHRGGDLEQSSRDSDPAEPEARGDAECDGTAAPVSVDGADREKDPDEHGCREQPPRRVGPRGRRWTLRGREGEARETGADGDQRDDLGRPEADVEHEHGQRGGDGDRGRDRGLDEEEGQRAQGGDGREEAESVEGEAGGIRPPRPDACEERGAGRQSAGAADAHGLEHGRGAVGERREEGAEQSERHAVIVATAAGRGLRVRGSAGTCS